MPVSEAHAERICSLPLFPGMSDVELEQIVDAVDGFTKDTTAPAR
jgi:dTDP-4-amino-4,6-dideoxygalactose transaminase